MSERECVCERYGWTKVGGARHSKMLRNKSDFASGGSQDRKRGCVF